MRGWVLFAVALAVALAGCGGDSDKGKGSSVARELKDPRTVPQATVTALPSPIPAVDVSAALRRPTAAPDVYVVKAGDTPSGIAEFLGVDLTELLRFNGIDDARSLRVGQQLRVPRTAQPSPTPGRPGTTPSGTPGRTVTPAVGTPTTPAAGTPGAGTPVRTPMPGGAATPTPAAAAGGTYTVQAGDTGCGIAAKLGVPVAALAQANGTTVDGLANLRVGQTLTVPTTRGPAGC